MIRPYLFISISLSTEPGNIKKTVQVGVDHIFPLFILHPHHQYIILNACIVDQHFNRIFFMCFHPSARVSMTSCFLLTSKGSSSPVPFVCPDRCQGIFSFCEIGFEINQHMITQGSQFDADGPADSPGSAGN